jgi:hypothetical protein
MGETLRTEDGKIVGMIIAIPRLYRLGDETLLGVAGGHFFIDASARLQGFFMIRRAMAMEGANFWYANSANRQSAPILAKCGAARVPESEVEYLFPFRLGPLIQEVALRKGWPASVARLLRAFGPLATIAAAPRLPAGRFRVDYCTDYEKLSALSDRYRRPDLLQPERSAPDLQWVYGTLPASPPPDESGAIFSFTDPGGHEGWFALSFDTRGHLDQIRCARLKDVVWPQERVPFIDVLPAIAETARPWADVLAIRGRVGLNLRDRNGGLRRRALLAPEAFLFCRSPAASELATRADFPFADRY